MSSAPGEAVCTHAESTRETKAAVNGPIFFLIREQAKSVVAIKELQSRMTVLEDIQERLMLAIQNVQHHLVATVESASDAVSANTTKESVQLLDIPKFPERTISSRDDIFLNANSNSSISSKDVAKDSKILSNAIPSSSGKCDSKGDSYNKDSGVDSDCREQESDCSLPTCPTGRCSRSSQSEDELLHLLDMIDQKSLLLLQQVEGIEKQKRSVQDMGETSKNGKSVSLDNLLAENMDAQRQLCEIKADRDDLRDRLAKLEFATDAVLNEKMKLQKTLDAMIFENRKLQEKIKECQDQEKSQDDPNARNNISLPTFKRDPMSESVLEKASIKQKYLQYSEKSRRKVSAVLKETNVIELQRQLLTYIMENDVLQAKLQQDHPSRLFHWMKVEARLKQELKRALHDKEDLLQKLEKSKAEIADLRCRIKELEEALMDEQQERCVKNFGLGSTDDWRDTSRFKGGNANVASPYSPLGFGDFSKTQSLPAMIHLDSEGQRVAHQPQNNNHYGQTYDTGNFTDVSLNRSTTPNTLMNSCQNSNVQKDLLDLNDNDDNCNSSLLSNSTYWNNPTLPAGISSATSSLCCQIHTKDHVRQRWDFTQEDIRRDQHSAKFLNRDVYWNREPKSDLDSICSEFDPLSEGASCENYVDSLNLSIPLKPTPVVSQLSSMGDSLHSASLDLGCASSALWNRTQKLCNARSVDGIRQFLVDNRNQSLYKERTSSPRYGQNSQTAGKVNRPIPVNIMECVRGTPDYTLL